MQKARVEAESSIELEQNCLSPTIESWKQTFEELEGRKKKPIMLNLPLVETYSRKKKKKKMSDTRQILKIFMKPDVLHVRSSSIRNIRRVNSRLWGRGVGDVELDRALKTNSVVLFFFFFFFHFVTENDTFQVCFRLLWKRKKKKKIGIDRGMKIGKVRENFAVVIFLSSSRNYFERIFINLIFNI